MIIYGTEFSKACYISSPIPLSLLLTHSCQTESVLQMTHWALTGSNYPSHMHSSLLCMLCAKQFSYLVQTAVGEQVQLLKVGLVYKSREGMYIHVISAVCLSVCLFSFSSFLFFFHTYRVPQAFAHQ